MKYVLYALTISLYLPLNLLCMQDIQDSEHLTNETNLIHTQIDAFLEQAETDMLIAYLLEVKSKENSNYNHAVYYALEVAQQKLLDGIAQSIIQIFSSDIDNECEDGLLHIAAQKNNIELIDLLVACGADVNSLSFEGDTPLHSAIGGRSHKAIQVLVEKYNCDISKRSSAEDDQYTPLELAIYLNYIDIIDYLKAHGASIYDVSDGRTALHIAASGSLEMTRHLLENGFNCNALDQVDNTTPLHYAVNALEVSYPIIQLLLAHGAQVNEVNEDGQTPLFFLISNYVRCITRPLEDHKNFLACIQLLCADGANSSIAQNKYRQTPLEVLVRTIHGANLVQPVCEAYIISIALELLRATMLKIDILLSNPKTITQQEILDTITSLRLAKTSQNDALLTTMIDIINNHTRMRDIVTKLLATHDLLTAQAYMVACSTYTINDLYTVASFKQLLLHAIATNDKASVKFYARHMDIAFQATAENPLHKAVVLRRLDIALLLLSISKKLLTNLFDQNKVNVFELALEHNKDGNGQKFVDALVQLADQTPATPFDLNAEFVDALVQLVDQTPVTPVDLNAQEEIDNVFSTLSDGAKRRKLIKPELDVN